MTSEIAHVNLRTLMNVCNDSNSSASEKKSNYLDF